MLLFEIIYRLISGVITVVFIIPVWIFFSILMIPFKITKGLLYHNFLSILVPEEEKFKNFYRLAFIFFITFSDFFKNIREISQLEIF